MYMKVYDRENKQYFIQKFLQRAVYNNESDEDDYQEEPLDIVPRMVIDDSIRKDFSFVLKELSVQEIPVRIVPFRIRSLKNDVPFVQFFVDGNDMSLYKYSVTAQDFDDIEQIVEDEHPVTTRFRLMLEDESIKMGIVTPKYHGFIVVDGTVIAFIDSPQASNENGIWIVPTPYDNYAEDATKLFADTRITTVTIDGDIAPIPSVGYICTIENNVLVNARDEIYLEKPIDFQGDYQYVFSQLPIGNGGIRYVLLGTEVEKDGAKYYVTHNYDNFIKMVA